MKFPNEMLETKLLEQLVQAKVWKNDIFYNTIVKRQFSKRFVQKNILKHLHSEISNLFLSKNNLQTNIFNTFSKMIFFFIKPTFSTRDNSIMRKCKIQKCRNAKCKNAKMQKCKNAKCKLHNAKCKNAEVQNAEMQD